MRKSHTDYINGCILQTRHEPVEQLNPSVILYPTTEPVCNNSDALFIHASTRPKLFSTPILCSVRESTVCVSICGLPTKVSQPDVEFYFTQSRLVICPAKYCHGWVCRTSLTLLLFFVIRLFLSALQPVHELLRLLQKHTLAFCRVPFIIPLQHSILSQHISFI